MLLVVLADVAALGLGLGQAEPALRRLRDDWSAAFEPQLREYTAVPVSVAAGGRLPDELRGTLFKNGPARFRRGDALVQLGELSKLRRLELDGNAFSGTVPCELGGAWRTADLPSPEPSSPRDARRNTAAASCATAD